MHQGQALHRLELQSEKGTLSAPSEPSTPTPSKFLETHWCIWRWQLLQGQICKAPEETTLHVLQDEHCLPLLACPRRAPHPVHVLVTICCHADLQPAIHSAGNTGRGVERNCVALTAHVLFWAPTGQGHVNNSLATHTCHP